MTAQCSRPIILTVLVGLALVPGVAARAQERFTIELAVRAAQFDPAEIRAPANKPIVIRIKNHDGKAIEFESDLLRVEKVIPANGSGVINVRPQKPGRYSFFDEFNPKATGTLIVE